MQNCQSGHMLIEYLKSRWLALIVLSASLLLAFVFPCAAQESTSRAQGYFFVAPGLRTHEEIVSGVTHVGGGGEVFVHKGLAAGAEIGYIRPWQETNESLGMLSLDASYHIPKSNKLVYFVFAGVSFGLHDRSFGPDPGTTDLLNFGFGGTYWFTGRKGFRFEIRDHLYTAETDRHYLEFRFAFTFR